MDENQKSEHEKDSEEIGDEKKEQETNENEIKINVEDEKKADKKKKEDPIAKEMAGIKKLHKDELIATVEGLLREKYALEKDKKQFEEKVTEKEKESLDYLDRYRRSLAEVENIRKRTQMDKQENLKYANFNLISDLLVILDDFQRAIDAAKEGQTDFENYQTGIEMIEKQFLDLLFKKYGVIKYGEAGEEFDPNRYQAMMMEEGDYDEETVADVFRKGYILHDRVIRPAQVKVGKPKA